MNARPTGRGKPRGQPQTQPRCVPCVGAHIVRPGNPAAAQTPRSTANAAPPRTLTGPLLRGGESGDRGIALPRNAARKKRRPAVRQPFRCAASFKQQPAVGQSLRPCHLPLTGRQNRREACGQPQKFAC